MKDTFIQQLPNIILTILMAIMMWWVQYTVMQSNKELREEFKETRTELRYSVQRVQDELRGNYVTKREFDTWRARP